MCFSRVGDELFTDSGSNTTSPTYINTTLSSIRTSYVQLSCAGASSHEFRSELFLQGLTLMLHLGKFNPSWGSPMDP